MLTNYIKIAYRNLRKHLGYAFINVTGLALGLACCLLIVLLVSHEWSYDRFHADGERIHRIYIEEETPDGEREPHLLTPPSLAADLDSAFAAIEGSTRVISAPGHFRIDDDTFVATFMLVDPGFLRMFSFPLAAGSSRSALDDLQSVVITQEAAARFFGAAPGEFDRVVGRRLTYVQGETDLAFEVAGVVETPPVTSSFTFDILMPFANYFLEENGRVVAGGNDWGSKNTLYVLFEAGTDAAAFEAGLAPFTRTTLAGRIDARRSAGYLAEGEEALRLRLQPLADVHLNPVVGNYYEAPAHDPAYSYVLAGIGLLVLLIACINFMTLSVGRSASRAREVGMRKVLGAYRAQLMRQFWGEALLLTLFALVAAVVLVALTLPEFNALVGKRLDPTSMNAWLMLVGVVGILLAVALVAGAYPAAILSRFEPARVLKGGIQTGRGRLTSVLVVLQFSVGVLLIFGTIVMYRQLDYMLEKDLGFEDDQLMVLHTAGLNGNQERSILEAMRGRMASHPDVTHVVRTGYAFTQSFDWSSWTAEDGRTIGAHMFGVDFGFLDAMEMDLVAGRDFSPQYPSDSTRSVLVNEAFVRTYGIDDPVGYELSGFGGFFGEIDPVVIGVVEDFNFRSLHEEVAPAVLNMHPDYYYGMSHMLLKLRPDGVQRSIEAAEDIWRSTFPDRPFRFTFLDEDIQAQYQQERRWSRLLSYSSALAILIAGMGLFGLATLSVARRRKEIGVRKVLGASISDVALLVVREIAILVGIAALIAFAPAYLGADRWLASFAYRTSISWWMFAVSGAAAMAIALLTVSYQTYRAAVTDPVRSLRAE